MDVSNALVHPPTLDSSGKNYSLWKTMTKMYIKSIDECAWVAVLDGWTPLRVTDDVGNITPEPESQWSADERLISSHNSRALKAIFISVDVPCFRMISNCVEACDAWFILQEQCEGSTSVRATKLRMLTIKFEILRMREDETIPAYYEKLCEISNEAVGHGEPISNERLVSKILRSLPERYNMNISSFEETVDVTSIRISDLVSKLVTFEMNLEQQKIDYYPKNVNFHVDKSASAIDVTDKLRKVNVKSGNKRTFAMSMGSSSNIRNVKRNFCPTSEIRNADNIQCREVGVIEALEELDVISDDDIEPDFMNVGNNVDNIALNIQDDDEMEISTNATNWYEIIFLCEFNTNIPDVSCTAVVEEHMIDPLKEMENNEALYEEVDNQCGELRNGICLLLDENRKSKDEVTRNEGLLTQRDVELGKLKDKVVSVERTFEYLNKGFNMLTEHHNITVCAKERNVSVIMENITNIGFSHEEKSKGKPKSYACHYCSTRGHIKSYCVKCLSDVDDLSAKQMFDSYQRNVSNSSMFDFGEMSNTEKDDKPCNVVYTSLHANISESWYFDSGCSRYMTDSKALLTDYGSTNGGNVFAKLSDIELRYQRLSHVDLKNLEKLIANDVVRRLPKFVIKRDVVCQPCQKRQQLRIAYPMLSTCNTTKCFELLHMNLMSSIEVESHGGKIISLDHGKVFENIFFDDVCTNHCSFHEYSALKTRHQTSVAVRKNKILQEMRNANVDPTSDVTSSDSTPKPESAENTPDSDDEHGRHFLHNSSRRDPLGHVRKNHTNTQLIGDVLEQMQT
ncbi:uncharacterized protein LOC131004938 [Salvia miltiorrhiza]|uniref:uncharacterized protein LOC131004938 n=1 Tax=Salvia miltiorrhiza TaxID=226208 RepID=UPI0025AD48AD|nr:uncharacterized protein LOC131004938 [Salvia miltiorrhiza]